MLCQLSYAPIYFAFIDLTEVDREGFFGTFTKLSLWLPASSTRRMAFVIFSVDERLSGRSQLSNEAVANFAAANADVAIAFASIDPRFAGRQRGA